MQSISVSFWGGGINKISCTGVEHVHVNGRFKDSWNFGFRAKKKVRFKDSKIHAIFLELRFFMKLETARFKIQRFTWNFKIQESRLMKLETFKRVVQNSDGVVQITHSFVQRGAQSNKSRLFDRFWPGFQNSWRQGSFAGKMNRAPISENYNATITFITTRSEKFLETMIPCTIKQIQGFHQISTGFSE